MAVKKVLFITGSRSDFYIQKPIIDAVKRSPFLSPLLVVTGSHLSKKFGNTKKELLNGKYKIVATIRNLVVHDDYAARLTSASNQLTKLIKVVKKVQPDFIIAPYDREESITAALVGAYMHIPVVHLGAGDRTRFNIDGVIRHSVTKLSNLFFCSTKKSTERVIKLGEEKWRVFHVGSTAGDRYKTVKNLSLSYLSKYLKLDIGKEPLLVFIQHPVSNWLNKTKKHIKVSLSSIDELNMPTVVIRSNSDPGTIAIKSQYNKFKFKNKKVRYFENIPENIFVNIMKKASVLIGNSSMGVSEAPLLKLPVVNIGMRQKDRQNAGNIIFVPHNKSKIIRAVRKSLFDRKYLQKIKRLKNPYGANGAANKMARILSKIPINKKLINKRITY